MVEILSSRLLLRPADYQKTLAFYRDALGLAVYREYPGGTVFFAGQGLIEIAGHRSPVAPAPAGGRRPTSGCRCAISLLRGHKWRLPEFGSPVTHGPSRGA